MFLSSPAKKKNFQDVFSCEHANYGIKNQLSLEKPIIDSMMILLFQCQQSATKLFATNNRFVESVRLFFDESANIWVMFQQKLII